MRKVFSVGIVAISVLLFSQYSSIAVILPPPQTVTLVWNYPVSSADIVYNVYQTTSLALPRNNWTLATNVTATTCRLPILSGNHFFVVTASNKVTRLESRL